MAEGRGGRVPESVRRLLRYLERRAAEGVRGTYRIELWDGGVRDFREETKPDLTREDADTKT